MNKLVEEIKKQKTILAPEWATFVKTGANKQRPPTQTDWWHIRASSVLKKVNKFGPVGTNALAKQYGGRRNRGHKPDRKVSASRNIVRKCLQQLEAAGLIKQQSIPKAGKVVTAEGKALLNSTKE